MISSLHQLAPGLLKWFWSRRIAATDCVDYRALNGITVKDAYPLPRVDETLDSLGGAQYFSTLDMASGYWQVEVDQGDRQKTAFSTPQGHFEFAVMPFGLCNAAATFQRLMEYVLVGFAVGTLLGLSRRYYSLFGNL